MVWSDESEDNFGHAMSFHPDRLLGNPPDNYTWIPLGTGLHGCIGPAFANVEMTLTLRTPARELGFATTYAPGKRRPSRGVATAFGGGGGKVVYRRSRPVQPLTDRDAQQVWA
jgi:cytochrome P450